MLELVVFGVLLLIGYMVFSWKRDDEKAISNIKAVPGAIKEKVKDLKHTFNMTIAIAIGIVFFIFSPDKFYFFVFTIFFTATIYYAMQKIANLKHVLTINFKDNRVGLYQMSQKRFNDYSIIDEAGKPATIKYRLYGKKAEIIIADGVKNRKIIVNPVTSNIDFVRNYKDAIMEIKEKLNKTLNEMIDLKAKLRYESMLQGVKLLEKLAVVDQLDVENWDNIRDNGAKEIKEIEEGMRK